MLGAKAPDITSGENTQTVPGSGSLGSGFDVLLSFTNKGGGNPTHRFDDSNTLTLTLTGTGINENSFYFFNSPPPGDIQSNVGAHVAGLPGSTSSFISNVPIPPAVWLLGSGLACLVVVRRQMKK